MDKLPGGSDVESVNKAQKGWSEGTEHLEGREACVVESCLLTIGCANIDCPIPFD